ncbi:family 10 glycosylhydrolase [Paenibacillus agaridevorans]|uniref:family 10 glycosylhydrolase n=1 Tax=Paenibacillus agaridevorans TaxID=171404 RepID=UPI001BE4A9FA|nr:family 10 glycosylhydrolase [Paenibacillus agaridevorans]
MNNRGLVSAEVESAPIDITIALEGRRRMISVINAIPANEAEDWLGLFTRSWGDSISVPPDGAAVVVGADHHVRQMVQGSGRRNDASGPDQLDIPEDGYVLASGGRLVDPGSSALFLAANFIKGDRIKLRLNGEVADHCEISGDAKSGLSLDLDQPAMFTTAEPFTVISGGLMGFESDGSAVLKIDGNAVSVDRDGRFACKLERSEGLHIIDVELCGRDGKGENRNVAVYFRACTQDERRKVLLWVDQRSNTSSWQSEDDVSHMLERAKRAGVTDIALDVKGVEGYVSYMRTPLSGRPHLSELRTDASTKAVPRLDVLQMFVDHGHRLGLRIHASLNVFAEGSILRSQYAVLDDHPDWEEVVFKPQDGGLLMRQRASEAPGLVAFANPANDEVRQHQMAIIREIMTGYDVDGLILDRCRYDHEAADFSELTRSRFTEYLERKGRRLESWPDDIFRYEGEVRVDGKFILDWWAFRAEVITGFIADVSRMVKGHNRREGGRKVELSAYVGSWYDAYYRNGANWASPDLLYDSRLLFQDGEVYTEDYLETGYIRYLDYLMIGTYQDTLPETEKYMTIGNIATKGEIPVYAGIAINQMNTCERQRAAFASAMRYTDGLMLFDASHADWDLLDATLPKISRHSPNS